MMTFVGAFDIVTVAGFVVVIIGVGMIIRNTLRKMRHGAPKVGRRKT